MKPRAAIIAILLATVALAAPQTALAEPSPLQAAESTDVIAVEPAPTEEEPAHDPAPSITYRTRVNDVWQAKQHDGAEAGGMAAGQLVTGLRVTLASPIEGQVQYQVHSNELGWKPSVRDGKTILVSGDDYIDAVRIALLGELSKTHTVKYRVYLDGLGWQKWVSDAKTAGAAGKGAAVKALQVEIVEKDEPGETQSEGIVGVSYRVKTSAWSAGVENYKIAGSSQEDARIRALRIGIDTGAYSGSLQYRVHRTNSGWTGWIDNWKSTGTKDDIDAIELRLTGEIADTHDIVYRPRVANIGWQRRLRNGETAGIAGSGQQIEALRVKLEPKAKRSGWVGAATNWSFYRNGQAVKGAWLNTSESPIDLSFTSKRRYWVDANGRLAVERFIRPATARDAGAYVAYATGDGSLFCGKRETARGIMLSDSSGRIFTTSRFLKTSAYDGSTQIYYLKNKGLYSVVKTGLFKVGGKRYYGYEDGRGYLMRSKTWWIAGKWYKASGSGALTNVNNQTSKHIERYVKWAVRIANDDSHGYSQYNRQGPDYDCSSLVCNALLAAGFPDSGASWTGNMYDCLTSIGFVWHDGTYDLRRGDIMLVHTDYRQHTEIYLGGGRLVGAHIAETGDIHGVSGDQTGNEISVGPYYDAPWQGYLRYRG